MSEISTDTQETTVENPRQEKKQDESICRAQLRHKAAQKRSRCF